MLRRTIEVLVVVLVRVAVEVLAKRITEVTTMRVIVASAEANLARKYCVCFKNSSLLFHFIALLLILPFNNFM